VGVFEHSLYYNGYAIVDIEESTKSIQQAVLVCSTFQRAMHTLIA